MGEVIYLPHPVWARHTLDFWRARHALPFDVVRGSADEVREVLCKLPQDAPRALICALRLLYERKQKDTPHS